MSTLQRFDLAQCHPLAAVRLHFHRRAPRVRHVLSRPDIRSHESSVRRGVQDAVADTSCTYNRKEFVMKAFAVRLLTVLTLAISASLVLLPPVAHAGLTATAVD
jgi:hypothetical protein